MSLYKPQSWKCGEKVVAYGLEFTVSCSEGMSGHSRGEIFEALFDQFVDHIKDFPNQREVIFFSRSKIAKLPQRSLEGWVVITAGEIFAALFNSLLTTLRTLET